MSVVPLEWTRMMGNLRVALTERDTLKAVTGPAHDDAMQRYVRAVDLIITDLGELQARRVLGAVTMILAKKERS